MAADPIVLPTENYEPYFRTLREFTRLVEENGDVIARIAAVVDGDLLYPDICDDSAGEGQTGHTPVVSVSKPGGVDCWGGAGVAGGFSDEPMLLEHGSTPTDNNAAENMHSATESHQNEALGMNPECEAAHEAQNPDYLRDYLDNVLCRGTPPPDVTLFGHIQNPRLRQLLVDNYRLDRLKRVKLHKNWALLRVLQGCESLLAQVVMPRLSSEVKALNLRSIKEIQNVVFPRRFSHESTVYAKYLRYIECLDAVRRVIQSLEAVSAELVDLPTLDRLGAELAILDGLLTRLKAKVSAETNGHYTYGSGQKDETDGGPRPSTNN